MNTTKNTLIASALSTAFMAGLNKESVVNNSISITLTDERDLVVTENDLNGEICDLTVTVIISRNFDSIEDFKPTQAQVSFDMQFLDCEHNRDANRWEWDGVTWLLHHGHDGQNILWRGCGEGVDSACSQLDIGEIDDEGIATQAIQNAFLYANTADSEALKSFAKEVFEVANRLMKAGEVEKG